jgi:hypothetical protein
MGDMTFELVTDPHVFALEIDPEPIAELFRIGERPPYADRGSLQDYGFFYAIRRTAHMQPPGCILTVPGVNATVKLHDGGDLSARLP